MESCRDEASDVTGVCHSCGLVSVSPFVLCFIDFMWAFMLQTLHFVCKDAKVKLSVCVEMVL